MSKPNDQQPVSHTTQGAPAPGTESSTDPTDLLLQVDQFIEARNLREPEHLVALETGQEIAQIVQQLGVDVTMIAGTRLFPLLQCSAISNTQINKTFGGELKALVRELVKLSEFGLPGNWEPGSALGGRQIDALRKMLLAIAEDVRVVLVRLADQLYRLRNAKSAEKSLRQQIAFETREIFAPLASRLGIWQIKWELEDLSFRFLEPEQYKKIATWLDEKRLDREAYIARVIADIQNKMDEAGIVGEVQGRPKHIYSIWKKMQRKEVSFQKVFDVRAVRILLDSVADCYTMLGVVHGNWRYLSGEFDDYIATPKDNKYQSLHTAVIGPENKTIEIQIRTQDMHAHAELGVAAHWSYKEGTAANPSYHKKISWLRSILDPPADSETDSNDDFIDRFKAEIFEDRVYAMTPAGDVIDLPSGATPLDFAYYVHTSLGHRCRGAKIGGRIVPLTHTLVNGDVVEVITAKEPKPSRDWLIPQLGYLASTRARAKLRSWFRRQDKEHTVSQGQALLEKEFKRLAIETPHITELAKEFKFDGATTLYGALGNGDITTNDVIRTIQRMTQPRKQEEVLPTKKQIQHKSKGQDIRIAGVGDLLTNMAQCCKPVPPDGITGYITQGRGVTIHRQDCGNILRLQSTHSERILEVSWTNDRPDKYPVDIVIEAYDREGLLKDITALLSVERTHIMSVSSQKDRDSLAVKLNMTLEIVGLDELSRILHKINNLTNVFSVSRA